jgi:hypothetical protein
MPAHAGTGGGGWPREDEQPASAPVSRYRYVPREREEYAARRALFLQSYRLSTRCDEEEEEEAMGLRGRVARRLRDAGVAGRAAAARAVSQARGAARRGNGCRPSREYHFLEGFAWSTYICTVYVRRCGMTARHHDTYAVDVQRFPDSL